MATTIKLKNGTGVPSAGSLVVGEPALDLTNKRLYTEDSGGTVIEVGTNPSTINIDAGTIDGTVIGGSTAAAGTFTTGQFNTSLNVDGTVTADGLTVDGLISTTASQSTDGQIRISNSTTRASGNKYGIRFADSSFETNASIYTEQGGSGNNAADLIFGTNGGTGGIVLTSATERMRINSSGNVGIGTSNPSTKLHLGGTAPGDSIIRQDSTASGTNWEIGEREAGKWQIFEDDGDSIVATFTSSGNVGIGTSSPGTPLDVAGGIRSINSSGNPVFYLNNGTTQHALMNDSNNFVFQNAGIERMRIASNGAVLVGKTSGTAGNTIETNGRISAAAGSSSLPTFNCEGDTNTGINLPESDRIQFITGGSERMRIDASGNLLVGTTDSTLVGRSDSGRVCIDNEDGNDCLQLKGSGTNHLNLASWIPLASGTMAHIGFGDGTASYTERGVITTNGTTTTYATTSDYRLKENVQPLSSGIQRLKTLKPSRFNFIETPSVTLDGFIAHEVADVVPEAVVGTKDEQRPDGTPKYQHLDASKLVPLLTAALQEQQAIIESLTARIEALEGAN